MSDERISIVLRGEDKEEFEELKKSEFFDDKTNVAIFRHILRFYKRNSPYYNFQGG